MRYPLLDKSLVIKQVKMYIKDERNFRNPNLTLSMVAEAVGVARSTIVKVFSEEMNITFLSYVDNCRLRYSRHLVMQNNGRFSMEHIATVAGYGSVRTFNKRYKEMYGELPGITCRRKVQKAKEKNM